MAGSPLASIPGDVGRVAAVRALLTTVAGNAQTPASLETDPGGISICTRLFRVRFAAQLK
jgi:hypothetical protein